MSLRSSVVSPKTGTAINAVVSPGANVTVWTVDSERKSTEAAAEPSPETKPDAKEIEGYVAFWKGVEITE